MTASPADAGSPSAGAETRQCPLLGDPCKRSCTQLCTLPFVAVPSPEDTVEPDDDVGPVTGSFCDGMVCPCPPTPPAVRTGEDDVAAPTAAQRHLAARLLRSDARSEVVADRIAQALAEAAARPVSGLAADSDVARWLTAAVELERELIPEAAVDGLMTAARAHTDRLLALLGGDQDDEDGAR